ncbi:hypothetical protein WJX72_000357 [[Myrmecia] bisecta]|uniref:Uncharacterized protein n=1 Tax=[Myrmecia] bisecta TaxID=41462 RepID=A0AAW1PKK4_9CHLO
MFMQFQSAGGSFVRAKAGPSASHKLVYRTLGDERELSIGNSLEAGQLSPLEALQEACAEEGWQLSLEQERPMPDLDADEDWEDILDEADDPWMRDPAALDDFLLDVNVAEATPQPSAYQDGSLREITRLELVKLLQEQPADTVALLDVSPLGERAPWPASFTQPVQIPLKQLLRDNVDHLWDQIVVVMACNELVARQGGVRCRRVFGFKDTRYCSAVPHTRLRGGRSLRARAAEDSKAETETSTSDNNAELRLEALERAARNKRGTQAAAQRAQMQSRREQKAKEQDSRGMAEWKEGQLFPEGWADMNVFQKVTELYVGRRGVLFWAAKLSYGAIFVLIGAWIVFRFVGPSLGLYNLSNDIQSPSPL